MRLAKFFGIDLRLNIFFILFFLVFYYSGIVIQALIVFVSVLVHEIGHVSVAWGYGIKTIEIELLPFGGVARLEKGLEAEPGVEIYVAMAGPITSIFLALIGISLQKTGTGNQEWLPFFIQSNLMLALFNLAPVYPLDGGRIIRAMLTFKLGLNRATEVSLKMARKVSVILAVVGLWSCFQNGGSDFNLIIISTFLIFSTVKEQKTMMFVLMKFLSNKKEDLVREGILVGRQLTTGQFALLKDVVKHFVPKKYHLVTVLDERHTILTTLTEGEIIDGLFRYGPDIEISALLKKHN